MGSELAVRPIRRAFTEDGKDEGIIVARLWFRSLLDTLSLTVDGGKLMLKLQCNRNGNKHLVALPKHWQILPKPNTLKHREPYVLVQSNSYCIQGVLLRLARHFKRRNLMNVISVVGVSRKYYVKKFWSIPHTSPATVNLDASKKTQGLLSSVM